MLELAWRNVRENPTRFALTALAITLGVAFYVATTVLTATVDQSLSGNVDERYDGIDVGVRSSEFSEGVFFDVRSPVDPSVLEQVATVDGVAAVAPSMRGYTQLVGIDGKVVGDAADVIVWSDSDGLNQLVLTAGRAPQTSDEVLINQSALDEGALEIGDAVRLLPQTDAGFTVVGAIDSASGNEIEGRTSLGLTFEGAAAVLGSADIDTILVETTDDSAVVVERIDRELSTDLEVVSGQTLSDEFKELLNSFVSIISIFLTSFAGVAVFVSVFVIYNTFSITVSQRQKEMATLRAIGATPKQVLRSVLVESLAIGVVASILGVLLGVVLGAILLQVLAAFGFSLGASTITVSPSSLLIGFLVGLTVTIVSAYFPARRGASVPPIEALRDTAVETVEASALRSRVGLALLSVGGVLAAIGATNLHYVIGGIGIVALFAGVVVAAPAIAPALASWFAAPLRQSRGIVGEVATQNSMRNPKRTATTALALMIGITLVVTATVVASSLNASIRGDLERGLSAELVVEAGSGRGGGLRPAVTESVIDLPSVDAASPVRPVTAVVDDLVVSLAAVEVAEFIQVADLAVTEGDIAALSPNGIAISVDEAASRGLALGDSITAAIGAQPATLDVKAIYDNTSVVGGLVVDTAVSQLHTGQVLDPLVLISTDDVDAATAELVALLAGDPTAEVMSTEQYIDDQAGTLDTLLNVLYGLLGLSVIIALLGVTNTMSLSIHERTRELGLMRAVGMTGPQLRSAIRYESGLVALVGAIGGLVLGVFFGWLVQRMTAETFPVFDAPWFTVGLIAAVGILAGVVAGWRPAARASQLNVLEAISH